MASNTSPAVSRSPIQAVPVAAAQDSSATLSLSPAAVRSQPVQPSRPGVDFAALQESVSSVVERSQQIDCLAKAIRVTYRDLPKMNVSELVRHTNELGVMINNLDRFMYMSLSTLDADVRESYDDLHQDFRTLATRVSIVSKQKVCTDAPSIHLGAVSQYSLGAQSACAGTAGKALETLMTMTPEEIDSINARSHLAATTMINDLVTSGIELYQHMLLVQREEQESIMGFMPEDGDADLQSAHISFTSDLAESGYFDKITRLSTLSIEQIPPGAAAFFKKQLQYLSDLGRGTSYPVGAAITCRGKIFALAILAPNKVVFFDSHGATETALGTDKAYMLVYNSIGGAASFLADLLPHERPDQNQIDTQAIAENTIGDMAFMRAQQELGRDAERDAVHKRARELEQDAALIGQATKQAEKNVADAIRTIEMRNTVGFCPVKLKPEAAAALAARRPATVALPASVTSVSPAPLSPRMPASFSLSRQSPPPAFSDRPFAFSSYANDDLLYGSGEERDYDSKERDGEPRRSLPAASLSSGSINFVSGPRGAFRPISQPPAVPVSASGLSSLASRRPNVRVNVNSPTGDDDFASVSPLNLARAGSDDDSHLPPDFRRRGAVDISAARGEQLAHMQAAAAAHEVPTSAAGKILWDIQQILNQPAFRTNDAQVQKLMASLTKLKTEHQQTAELLFALAPEEMFVEDRHLSSCKQAIADLLPHV